MGPFSDIPVTNDLVIVVMVIGSLLVASVQRLYDNAPMNSKMIGLKNRIEQWTMLGPTDWKEQIKLPLQSPKSPQKVPIPYIFWKISCCIRVSVDKVVCLGGLAKVCWYGSVMGTEKPNVNICFKFNVHFCQVNKDHFGSDTFTPQNLNRHVWEGHMPDHCVDRASRDITLMQQKPNSECSFSDVEEDITLTCLCLRGLRGVMMLCIHYQGQNKNKKDLWFVVVRLWWLWRWHHHVFLWCAPSPKVWHNGVGLTLSVGGVLGAVLLTWL